MSRRRNIEPSDWLRVVAKGGAKMLPVIGGFLAEGVDLWFKHLECKPDSRDIERQLAALAARVTTQGITLDALNNALAAPDVVEDTFRQPLEDLQYALAHPDAPSQHVTAVLQRITRRFADLDSFRQACETQFANFVAALRQLESRVSILEEHVGHLRLTARLPLDYQSRIKSFLVEYLGTPGYPVPFGGRDAELRGLTSWLDDTTAAPFLLLATPAGRGKSALLCRWVTDLTTREDVAVVFVPVSIRFRTNLSQVALTCAVSQLAELHGDGSPSPDAPTEVLRDMLSHYIGRPLPKDRRLLLIFDGVDEAADWLPGPDIWPAPVPTHLRVIVSARLLAGDRGQESWLQRLGWSRPGLSHALDLPCLGETGVADVLFRMGFPLDSLGRRVDIIAELCRLSGGDPLLLRLYVDDLWARGLAAVRLRPTDLSAIRPGLDGYFERWWHDQETLWGKAAPLRRRAVQAVFDVLSAALGPLGHDEVLMLAPAQLRLSTHDLEESLRCVRRLVIGDGRYQGYVLSHSRLAEHFYQRLSVAERKVLDRSFITMGRETLAGLRDGSILPHETPQYVLQYYGAHLSREKAHPRAFLSLTTDYWRKAWESYEGTLIGFMNDVHRAWNAATLANVEAARVGVRPWALGSEIRCAMICASLNSLAQNIPPTLLPALMRHNLWSESRTLAHVRLMPEDVDRSDAIAELAPHLSPDGLVRATEMSRALTCALPCVKALSSIAGHVSGSLRDQVVAEALKITLSCGNDTSLQAQCFALLGEHLPQETRDRLCEVVFARAAKLANPYSKANAFAGLMPYLSEQQRETVLGVALLEARGDGYLAQWVMALAPHLRTPERDSLVQEVVEHYEVFRFPIMYPRLLSQLAPYLPDPLVLQAYEAIKEMPLPVSRAQVAIALLPRLPVELRRDAVSRVCKDAQRSSDARRGAQALCSVASYLTGPKATEVLRRALEVARSIRDIAPCMDALRQLLSYTPRSLRPPVVRRGMELAKHVQYVDQRAQAMLHLLPYLPANQRTEVCDKVLSVITANLDACEDLIPTLASYLGPAQLDKLWAAVKGADNDQATVVRWKADIVRYLRPSEAHAVVPQLMEEALGIELAFDKARVLLCLLECLEGQRRELAIETIGKVVHHLEPDERIEILVGLAQTQSGSDKEATVREAMRGAWSLPEIMIPHAMRILAPLLERDLANQALPIIDRLKTDDDRADVIIALAPRLGARELRVAATVALDIASVHHRARALCAALSSLNASEAVTLYRHLHEVLIGLSRGSRLTLVSEMASLSALLNGSGGPKVLAETSRAILDVCEWWP